MGAAASPYHVPSFPAGGAAFATQSKAVQIKSLPWQGADETFRKLSKQCLVLTPGAVDLSRGLFICCHNGVILAPLQQPEMGCSIEREPCKTLLSRASRKADKKMEKKGTYTRGVSLPMGTIGPGSCQDVRKGHR